MKIRGRCTKRKNTSVDSLAREIQARQLARLGCQVDAVIDQAVGRLIAGDDATLGDMRLVKAALSVAEFHAAAGAAS